LSGSATSASSGDVGELLHRQALAAQRLDELLAPGLDGVLAPLAREPLADLVGGPGVTTMLSQSRDGPAPSTLEVKISTRVARAELGVEGHEAAVDPGADAGVADLGVDGVGEVDGRGARRAG
jgi:hypothetical protein